jgi:hypothetical protein
MIKSAGFRRLNMLLKLLRFVGYVITVMFCSYVACLHSLQPLFLTFLGGTDEGAAGNNNKSKTAERGKYMCITAVAILLRFVRLM